MKHKLFKRAIVMMLALAMLITSTGLTTFAASLKEDAAKPDAKATAAEQTAEAREDAEPTEEAAEAAEDADEAGELTAADWEALLPETVSTDAREAMAEIAKSQAGGDIALYKAFANADSLEKGDAAFVMFVLDYANVLGAGDAIKDDSKAIVKSGDLDIPVDADTEAWVKALTDADLYTEAGKGDMPQLGDIAFVNGMAAVVTEIAEDGSYTFSGQKDAEAATVDEYNAEAETIEGFVSLEAIAPDMFVEAEDEQPAEEPVVKEEAAEAKEDAEAVEKTEEELKDEEKAAEEAKKTEDAAKAEEEVAEKAETEAVKEAENKAIKKGLYRQTLEADLVAAPGAGGKLKAIGRTLSGADKNTKISLTGMLPDGAYVKAYPVKVEVPGHNVIAAYDITIYVKNEDGNESVWQPEAPLNVSITNKEITEASEKAAEDSSFSVFHMENKDAKAVKVEDLDLAGGEASFEAGSFSIYAVTEEAEAVRAHYRFWMSKDEATSASGTPYRTISLLNDEELLAPADPTDTTKGKFTGWKYKADDNAVSFPVTASVSGDADTYIDIYAEFDGAQYATFMSLPEGTSRTVYHIAELTENNGTYSIDLSAVPAYGGPNGYRFVGWTTQRPTDAKGYGENTAKSNYYKDEITGLDGSVTLYPVCKKVYNVSFNGNGGLVQNLPVYKVLVTGDDTWSEVLTKVNRVERTGYSKNNGWFDGADNDANPVTLHGDVNITEDTSYYAHWDATTTKVTIKYWKEPVDNVESHHVPYELIDSEEVAVPTGTTLTLNKSSMAIGSKTLAADTIRNNIANGGAKVSSGNFTADSDLNYFNTSAVTAYDANGDYHSTNSTPGSLNVSVADDGSTIVDVWYNRKVYQLNFTFKLRSFGTNAYVDNGGLSRVNTKFPTSGTFKIRLGESLSGKWPNVNDYEFSPIGSLGFSVVSIGKRQSGDSYPDAVSAIFDTPLAYVNSNLLNCADGSGKIELWGRYNNNNFKGGLVTATVTEYYQNADGTYSSTSQNYKYGKGNTQSDAEEYTTPNYPGYVLNAQKTLQNNGSAYNVEQNPNGTVSITYKRDGPYTAKVYYDLAPYTATLQYGDTPLTDSAATINYKHVIDTALRSSDIAGVYTDPFSSGKIPDYMEFGGWYTDEDCNENYKLTNTTTMPASNVILYAKLTNKQITVSIDNGKEDADQIKTDQPLNMSGSEFGNGVRKLEYGTDNCENKYYAHKNTVAEFMPTYWTNPVWENHVFKGWKIREKDTSGSWGAWEDLADLNMIVDHDIELQAQWQDMTQHQIHYIEEGKEVYLDTNKYVEGCNVVIKGTDTEIYDKATETSKVFKYWLGEDGTTKYYPGDTLEMGTTDITLTAVFETGGSSSGSKKATYTFVSPSGSDWDTYYEEIVYKGERLSPPPVNPTKDDSTFQGWFRDEECKVKFEGFGTVNAPTDTTLYASFRSPYRVTYLGQEDELITVQNYSGDGSEFLDTSGVGENYSYSSQFAVIGWTTEKTTPGDRPAKIYNGLSELHVTSDLTMYPVLEGGNNLTFVTADDATQVPAKFYANSQNLNFTWPDPDDITRENYTFTGKWYTDPACENEFNWNTTLTDDTTIYAGWKINDNVDLKSNYTVAWWIEKADSNGDRNDISNYYYSNSVVVSDVNVGTQIGRDTTVSANGNNGAASNVEHAENIASNQRQYFEYYMAKVSYAAGLEGNNVASLSGNGTAPIDKSGKTTLNIFISRKRFPVNFALNSVGTIQYDGTTIPRNSSWSLPGGGWLEMPWAGKWPTFDGNGTTTPKLAMYDNYGYGRWYASVGTGVKTTPVMLSADNLPANGSGSVTFTLQRANKANSTYHANYRFRDNAQSQYSSTDYKGMSYDQTFDTAVNLQEKEFTGYTYDKVEKSGTSQDSGFQYTDYTFYYTRDTKNLIIRDSRNPNTNIKTISVMVGESLEGKVNDTDPCTAYNITAPEGMEFDAWSRSSASVVPISFTNTAETMPNNQMVVYAHWRTQTVTVTYEDEEGTVLNTVTKDINTKFREFGLTPQDKPGYAFVRWENKETGAAINNSAPVTENITVIAKYKSLTSKPVYYDLNGASVSGGNPLDNTTLADGKYKDNDVYVLGATVPVKHLNTEGVTAPVGTVSFVYWSTTADGSGKLYYPDDVIELPEDNDTTLYAIWSPSMTTTLHYDLNYTGKPANKQVVLNDYKELAENALKVNDNYEVGTEYNSTSKAYESLKYTVGDKNYTAGGMRPGYSLTGWDESDDEGVTPAYEDGDTIRATSYKAEDGSYLETQTLYAHWNRDEFDVEAYEIVKGVENTTATEGYTGKFGLPDDATVPAEYNCGATESGRLDTAYLDQISKSFPSGAAYAYAKIGGAKVLKVQYVAVTNPQGHITGYKWQYTTDGNTWNDFIAHGSNKTIVKLYYYQETIEVPIRYLDRAADGTLTEISSTDWSVPTGDANTKASIGTTATSYGKTSTDTKTFADEIASTTGGFKLHYAGTAIGAKTGTPALESGVDPADDYFLQNSAEGVKHANSAAGLSEEGVAVKTGDFAIYVVYEEQPAYIKISNNSAKKDFTFRLKIANGSYTEGLRTDSGDASASEGHYDLAIDKETSKLVYIPYGADLAYEVKLFKGSTEVTDLSDESVEWTTGTGFDNATGTLVAGPLLAADAEVTQPTEYKHVAIKDVEAHGLTVTNTIDGEYADMTRTFDITITLTKKNADAVIAQSEIPEVTRPEGATEPAFSLSADGKSAVMTVSLGHNGSVTIPEIPAGWKYSISEGDHAGYDLTYKTGSVAETAEAPTAVEMGSSDVSVVLKNLFQDGSVVPSGIAGSINMMLLIVLAFVLATAEFYIVLRRRRRGDA